MKAIIIGAGNIGRRHAESILKERAVTRLDIVDPSGRALKQASKLLKNELEQMRSTINIMLSKKVDPFGTYDVAIIATSAVERYQAIQSVKLRAKYLILEKFLFNTLKEYSIDLRNNITYVNCPRRVMRGYQQFKGPNPTIFYYGMEGLLSNTIHFADLLSYLTGNKIVSFDIDIDKKIRTKRWGYKDAKGRVIINCGGGLAYLSTTWGGKEKESFYCVNDHRINEEGRIATLLDGTTQPFDFKYQSELTASYLQDIQNKGICGLASYEESRQWHMSFIDQLRKEGWAKNIT